jgi:hypothetical protein
MLAVQLLVPKPTYMAAIKERDEAREELKQAQADLIARNADVIPRADYQAQHEELARLRTKVEDDMIPSVFRATHTLEQTLTVLSRLAERAPL